MPRITFQVTVPPDPTKQHVVVVGSDKALGAWQPEKGLVLERRPDGRYTGDIELPDGLTEFKITRGSWATEETFKDGSACLNYHYLLTHDLSLEIEVENWKDAPPWDPDRIFGKALEIELHATQFDETRHALVWLPPGYMSADDSRHPVLYLLDGQDTLAALETPDNETLRADLWARNLAAARIIPELILVAVFHDARFGQRDLELSPQADGPKMADFLVHDLKPFLDYTLCRDRTLAAPEHTGVLGFSLGGALALHMAQHHSATFGRFASLSTCYEDLSADSPDDCRLIRSIAADKTFRPNRRLYFDHGTLGGDASVHLYQEKMDAVLRGKKFIENRDFKTLVAEGCDHNLATFRARLGAPLQFLFGK